MISDPQQPHNQSLNAYQNISWRIGDILSKRYWLVCCVHDMFSIHQLGYYDIPIYSSPSIPTNFLTTIKKFLTKLWLRSRKVVDFDIWLCKKKWIKMKKPTRKGRKKLRISICDMRSDNGCDDIWVKTLFQYITNFRRFKTKDRFCFMH